MFKIKKSIIENYQKKSHSLIIRLISLIFTLKIK
jgi:hypothetical protein